MKKKLKLTLKEVNDFEELFSSMLETKGHGLTFILTKNKYQLIKDLKVVEEQFEIAKKPFLTDKCKAIFNENDFVRKFEENYKLKENEKVGYKLEGKDQKELQNALNQLSEQTFKIDLIDLHSELFEIACNDRIFDNIDLINYFTFKDKFN